MYCGACCACGFGGNQVLVLLGPPLPPVGVVMVRAYAGGARSGRNSVARESCGTGVSDMDEVL